MPPAIAFMHIPKTAGLSVIHAFQHALGADRCLAFHPSITDADFAHASFISGHLVLSTITSNAWRFTFLREPLAQLASHLRWLDRYNHEPYIAEAAAFSDSMKSVIARVAATDFASARSLQSLFDWLPPDSDARLIDVQCDVLARRYDGTTFRTPDDLADAAIANLPTLDFVGLVEHLPADLQRLFRRLDLPPPRITRQNTQSSPRRINLRDKAIRQVLAPQVRADRRLYYAAIRARGPTRRLLDLLPTSF